MSLTPKDWKELKPLFEQAVSLPPEERSAFVEEVRVRSGRLGDQLAELIGAGPLDVLDEPLIKFHEFFPSRSEVLLSQSSGTMPLLKSPVPNETPADIPGNQLPTCLRAATSSSERSVTAGASAMYFWPPICTSTPSP